jgi:hypothetical protein
MKKNVSPIREKDSRAWELLTISEPTSFKLQFQMLHVLQCLLKMQIIPVKLQFQTYSKYDCALYISDFEKPHLLLKLHSVSQINIQFVLQSLNYDSI